MAQIQIKNEVCNNSGDSKQDDSTYTKKPRFYINDHVDILLEVLPRLDGPSLSSAACVCRLWYSIIQNDAVWEHLCFRHVSPPPPPQLRAVVAALGGYRRLYLGFMKPILSRLRAGSSGSARVGVQLSLSLFWVDCYERGIGCDASTTPLMYLCKPVNV